MNLIKKIIAIVTALTVFSMVGGPVLAVTAEELQAQITALLAQLTTLQAQLATLQGQPAVSGCTITSFDRNLSQGMSGDDVKCLQIILNSSTDTKVADSGAGSSGSETTYFGSLTKAAVIKFQEKYASEILATYGLTTGTGFVGTTTRAKLNTLIGAVPAGCDCTTWVSGACGAGTCTTGQKQQTRTCTPAACTAETQCVTDATCAVAAGTVAVALSSVTPAATTIPANATAAANNVPVTKVNLTAGGSDVTITGLKVLRSGLSQDAAISSVKLFDGTIQVGTSQSLGADHKAKFSSISISVPANTTKTITLAATMASVATYSGNIINLGIDSASDITTTATISGTFPIVGNSMTLTSSVTIGTALLYNGSSGTRNTTNLTVDPSEVDVRFTQVKITAGSAEGLNITQITAIKQGTAATTDVKDIKLVNDTAGTTLGTVAALSADGKAIFSNLNVSVAKGGSIELSILATMIGGSGRTLTFDLYDGTAYTIDIVGTAYGFGITPTRSDFCTVTTQICVAQGINQGYLTVQKSGKTPATGNISIGGSEIKLAGFDFAAYGEPISVSQTVVTITPAGAASQATDWTNVIGYDANGNTLFGPLDPDETTAATADTLTFTDAYTLPIGTNVVYVKGNLSSSVTAGETVYISLAAGSITAKGGNSGKTTYTTSGGSTVPPASAVTANTMTIVGPALKVVTAAVPIAGNIVTNAQDAIFAYFDLDASASGEDVKVTTIVTTDTLGDTVYTGINNLELWDGSTKIETTSSTATNAATVTFTLKTPLRVTVGTIKRLTLKADVVSTTGTSHTFKIADADDQVVSTGWTTGKAVGETYSGSGQAQTISSIGTLQMTVSADRAAAAQFVAGATGNSMMTYRLYANYEDIDITGFYIATTSATAKADVAKVKLYLDGTQIGNPAGYTLDSGGDAYVSLTSGTMVVPKATYKTLAIKVDLVDKTNLTDAATLEIGLGTDATYNDAGWTTLDGAYSAAGHYYYITATGLSSGSTVTQNAINSLTNATTGKVAASYIHYLYDGVLVVSLSSSSPSGTQTPGAGKEVLRLDLQAVGDDIEINEMEFCVSGTATDTNGTGSLTIKSSDLGTTFATVSSGDFDTYWDAVIQSQTWYIMDPSRSAVGGNCLSVGDQGGLTATKNIKDFDTTIEIASGTTKTIKVFADTSGAVATKTLQMSLEANATAANAATKSGIEWQNNTGTDVGDDAAETLTKNTPVSGGSLVY